MKKNTKGYEFRYAEFSEAMREARRGRGMTLKTVAQVLHKSQATISRYENMKVAPLLADFLAICMFYDFEPMRFLFVDKVITKTIEMFDSKFQENSRTGDKAS